MNHIIEVQCQGCGMTAKVHDHYPLPDEWVFGAYKHAAHQQVIFCPDCAEWMAEILIIEEEPPGLMGSEYTEEFDPDYWGPDDIGLRAPIDGFWVAS